jgi:hypothetical protein
VSQKPAKKQHNCRATGNHRRAAEMLERGGKEVGRPGARLVFSLKACAIAALTMNGTNASDEE